MLMENRVKNQKGAGEFKKSGWVPNTERKRKWSRQTLTTNAVPCWGQLPLVWNTRSGEETPVSAHMSQAKQLKGVGRRDQLDRQASVSSGWGNPSLPPPHDPSITPSPSNHASIHPSLPERSRQHTVLALYQPSMWDQHFYTIKLLTNSHLSTSKIKCITCATLIFSSTKLQLCHQ